MVPRHGTALIFVSMQVGDAAGDFKIEARLGHGGMADVWLAYHPQTQRRVAIKSIRPDLPLDHGLRERFRQEARILANLDHPGIVRVLHAFEQDGTLLLVMEFIEGRTLEVVRIAAAEIAEQQILEWFRQLANALSYVHRMGVLHRDIKPTNVIIDANSARARLVDFGIALPIASNDPRLTSGPQSPQTPAYASPEQRFQDPVDHRSDVYSLALTMLSAWTGRVPDRRPDGGHAWSLPPDAQPNTVAIFKRCLALRPDDRYPHAEQLAADLGGGIQGARTVPRALVSPMFKRVAFGAAAVVAVGIGLAESWTLWLRPSEMISIPAGSYVAGVDSQSLSKVIPEGIRNWDRLTRGGPTKVSTNAFQIDRYEVTNSQYAEFVKDTHGTPPPHWKGLRPPTDLLQHPVVNVTFQEASDYAAWAAKRLPTADEWERAARGDQGLLYPWGNEFRKSFTNTEESGIGGTSEVSTFPQDVSLYGLVGMGGNVTEWTSTPATGEDGYVVSGGSWMEMGLVVSLPSLRRVGHTQQRYSDVGFRCAR